MSKKIGSLICFSLVFSFLAHAGIGDIIGGSSGERQRFTRFIKNSSTHVDGDTVHFQEYSMWVRASINKSLCFDGNYYQAIVSLCVEFDSRGECVRTQRRRVYQPEISTKIKCTQMTERSCEEYTEVLYRQNPVRKITLRERPDSSNVLATGLVRIRSCQ